MDHFDPNAGRTYFNAAMKNNWPDVYIPRFVAGYGKAFGSSSIWKVSWRVECATDLVNCIVAHEKTHQKLCRDACKNWPIDKHHSDEVKDPDGDWTLAADEDIVPLMNAASYNSFPSLNLQSDAEVLAEASSTLVFPGLDNALTGWKMDMFRQRAVAPVWSNLDVDWSVKGARWYGRKRDADGKIIIVESER
jgi:hypothetical protein